MLLAFEPQAENPSAYFDGLPPDEQKEVLEWRERHQQVGGLDISSIVAHI